MSRRKYKFRDRAAAEAAYTEQERLNDYYRLALEAVIAGRAEWIRGDNYDGAVVDADRADGGVAAVVWHARGLGLDQRPSVTVYPTEELGEVIEKLGHSAPTDDLGREYRDLFYTLRQRAWAVQNAAWGVRQGELHQNA